MPSYAPTPGLMRRLGFRDITTPEDLDVLVSCWSRTVPARQLRYVVPQGPPMPDVELVANLPFDDDRAQLFEIRNIDGLGPQEFDRFIGYLPSEAFFLELLPALGWPPAMLISTTNI